MKRRINTFFALALGAFALISCNANDLPKFNDADAFIAFDKSSISVDENAGTVNIPITLVSLNGIESTATIETADGTAISGTDFSLSSSSVSFSKGSAQQNVVVNINDLAGEFTGDKSFTVKITSGGNVNVGSNNTCTVTIKDLDHPLSPILGAWSGNAGDYFANGGSTPVTLELEKDASDVTKVWIKGWSPYIISMGGNPKYYGIVSEDLTTIEIPAGQGSGMSMGYGDLCITGFAGDDPDASDMLNSGEMIVLTIDLANNTMTTTQAFGIMDDSYYWDLFYGNVTFTKQ